MAETTLSSQIYTSRDSIREQISDQVKNYLELENVDLTKSSFLSFMIDILSTLTSNLLFYQISAYREFFLTKAQLPDSILNLSAFLGYNTREATPATAVVLLTFPFGFEDPSVQFVLPNGFKFRANTDVEFRTTYETTVVVTNNANVTVTVVEGVKKYNLYVNKTVDSFQFTLPLTQVVNTEQEFQIDSDTQQYQFVNIDVPISGEVASLVVKIREPGSAGYTIWNEYQSLFLMSNTDKGYVSRRTDTGRRISFGNGLFGVQPTPGSSVIVTVGVTDGENGNVIAGSIKDGDRVYITTGSGSTQLVDYSVINASPAFGGINEESLESVRRNSIASLTSLNRLVTENDYKNINVIVENSPIAQNSLPVLKRSDLQVNEIELFTAIIFGTGEDEVDNLVPTRNAKYSVPTSQYRIPRDTIIDIGGVDYLTIFDIDIDIINEVGNYEYTIYSVKITPALETSYPTSSYNIVADQLHVYSEGTKGVFRLHYSSDEVDPELCSCEFKIRSSGTTALMTNDSTASEFVVEFDPYTTLPTDEQFFDFTISDPSNNLVATYSGQVTFRKPLSNFMRSNASVDGTNIIVYDIPVIQKEYYDSIDKEVFELQILQNIISSMDLSEYKMLTDFSNIKFTNTTGIMQNMLLNQPTISDVIDIVTAPPPTANVGDRYILVGVDCANDPLTGTIIQCIDSSAYPVVYLFDEPTADAIVYVVNKDMNYIFSDNGWIELPLYNIPLEIEIEVFRSLSYSGTVSSLINTVRETIYNTFKERFGSNATIYRSEIINAVQEIDGVSHCRLKKPETSIFFNFELIQLTEDQLLEYGPEYVYFTKDSITVRVV
jgi:hypothetical protein